MKKRGLFKLKIFIKRNLQPIYFFFNRQRIYYVVENSDWVIFNIARILKKNIGTKFIVSNTHKGIRNSIVHFGSINSILTPSGTSIPHHSNKIIVSYNHVVPNDKRHKFLDTLISTVDVWHVTNSITYNDLIKIGVIPQKIVLIPLGVDLNKFKKSEKEEKLKIKKNLGIPFDKLVIGSFQKDGNGWGEGLTPKLIKGPDIFCNVVKKLSKQMEVFVLLTGPARGYVKKRLDTEGIPYKHFYLKDASSINKFYKALDIYFVTSRVEGGPMSVLESLASGVPLVSTKVGMAVDIIKNNHNGILVDVEDEINFLNEVKSLLSDETVLKKQILNGLKTASKFDWKIISKRTENLYTKVIKNE